MNNKFSKFSSAELYTISFLIKEYIRRQLRYVDNNKYYDNYSVQRQIDLIISRLDEEIVDELDNRGAFLSGENEVSY